MIRAIRDWGLPALAQHATDAQLRDAWLNGWSPGLTKVQRLVNLLALLSDIGPHEKINDVARELLNVARGRPVEAEAVAAIERYAPHLRDADKLTD